MAKKNTAKKVSAIDAIKQPFQYESKSTQTHSPAKDVRLGGTVKTVSVRKKARDEDGNVVFVYESKSSVEGGQVIPASYRIRTGKTKRERGAKVREVVKTAPATSSKKKK
ncbi:hypothetical protein pEaSNUABM56_00165 [Erwinia phage pEa_SNUABM_56]|uniref:Uncharacterized protein n=1 Tax=Erwinia phage pEp_SNUABM_01 TaxID=2601643 RepID=A0A5J6DAN1_9CAUD|nr:hypothetical protein HWC63_gp236 [Erwinia phage pEp_SNUABM_01]QEQ94942.1 hypothetical protein pEpSNUABM01_116 [Erwinia phage pEp_SNUABM_01]UYL84868.1 hypothetical protein pEaSNUABM55_00094 [Erwinia phage pEa_SNUABM_55]UYL85186.1 hypothetical protein pEaSNUABM56_00165 [Erwinia phage pEa_SNUABM_56]